MLKHQLTAATHITRKAGPWVGIAAMLALAANDLRKKN